MRILNTKSSFHYIGMKLLQVEFPKPKIQLSSRLESMKHVTIPSRKWKSIQSFTFFRENVGNPILVVHREHLFYTSILKAEHPGLVIQSHLSVHTQQIFSGSCRCFEYLFVLWFIKFSFCLGNKKIRCLQTLRILQQEQMDINYISPHFQSKYFQRIQTNIVQRKLVSLFSASDEQDPLASWPICAIVWIIGNQHLWLVCSSCLTPNKFMTMQRRGIT